MGMTDKIFAYFKGHKTVMWLSLAALTAIFSCVALNISFSENINDFLPLDKEDRQSLDVYGNISGASRLVILFSNPGDADKTVSAMEYFAERVCSKDSLGWCGDLTLQVDMEQIEQVSDFVYDNMPYFLDESDYARMDSLLTSPSYIERKLEEDKNMLLFPSGPMVSNIISRDPLGLFTPVMSQLQKTSPGVGFQMYDSYIFTPDMSRAVAMLTSPFGNSETANNSKLVALLKEAIEEMETEYEGVTADLVGGPEIAVGNSSRIKKDSILAISLSVILIVLLVIFAIGSWRNVLLIFLSIGWGWLFAIAGITLFSGSVSIIVIGISSVILGIAVNYPLHLIAHVSHVRDIRVALKETVSPLVIGNITTVGAFFALIPLKAAALRDLGIFASLLLVGTIVFVLLYLPHMTQIKSVRPRGSKILDKLSALEPDKSAVLVGIMAVLTIILSVFSFRTGFDTDMSNINYMTSRQREDMEYFSKLFSANSNPQVRSVYVLSSGKDWDEALSSSAGQKAVIDSLVAAGKAETASGVAPFLVSKAEQERRLGLWRDFVLTHEEALGPRFHKAATECGFSSSAFGDFDKLVVHADSFAPRDMEHFGLLSNLILSRNLTELDGVPYVVDEIRVHEDNLEEVKACFDHCFDVQSLNSSMASNLSDNFNYIGWACSLIVFFFLWFSFGRLELALISFLPMALSWVWILGIMALLGIRFNIVNIILATFIFGQGDDYTIFMTEGCQYEYARRKSILPSYKSSILQSALIMFVGIGTLIVAKHPAMRSLAEVTITGMSSVVLMSYVIPPLLFRCMTTKKGKTRRYPLTLRSLFAGEPADAKSLVMGRYIYKGKEVERTVRRSLGSFDCAALNLPSSGEYHMDGGKYGEKALLVALENPALSIVASVSDEDALCIARVAAMDLVNNLKFAE